MDFNHYFTNEELDILLPQWASAQSGLVSLSTIGRSFEDRPIWLMTLTNQATGPDTEKPAIWIDANIHATEIAGTTTALFIIHTLLDRYGQDERITRLLDQCVYYVAPRLNPDGAALAMAANPRFIRSGVRTYPWNERDEGLHEQDMDGDGRILQMRIPDPNGDWKVSSLDPRLMEKRDPVESGGSYYRLLPEGMIEGYDGYLIRMARPPEGLDFNRNFPFEWRPEDQQNGAGPYPVSEPEVKAQVDFVTRHPNINAALTYHTFSRVILRPYSTRPDDQMETQDLWVYQMIGGLGSQLTGYRNASTFHEFKYHPKEVTTGAFDDWLFDHLGVFTFTVEQWDLPTEAGIKERKFSEWFRIHPHTEDLQILHWADQHAGEGAYVNWYSFEHPLLGPVELGGWNPMFTWRNPPPALMAGEAERNLPFAQALGDMLPHLHIARLIVTPLGEDHYHLNLVVENTGFLPTYTSQQSKNRQAARPVRVELDLPEGATLVDGKRRVELGHLEGRSSKLAVFAPWGESETNNRARAEWVLCAAPGTCVTIHLLSDRAGSLHCPIELLP